MYAVAGLELSQAWLTQPVPPSGHSWPDVGKRTSMLVSDGNLDGTVPSYPRNRGFRFMAFILLLVSMFHKCGRPGRGVYQMQV